MANWLQRQWRGYSVWLIALLPLSFLFLLLVTTRKYLFKVGFLKSCKLPVPVIVVGNISVGGTGKTPLVLWLAEHLKKKGFIPGVISRGYGGSASEVTEVFTDGIPAKIGDEPLLIARRTCSPVFVGANRVDAGKALLKAYPMVNVIISDDGLQHYRLQRDFEFAVVDAGRGFGNGFLLPAGPLRETKSRMASVDAIVMTSSKKTLPIPTNLLPPLFEMEFSGDWFVSLFDCKTTQKSNFFNDKTLVAIAGIGNPERFYEALTKMGLVFERKSFADHHAFTPHDIESFVGKTILMTEKDAVKCEKFAFGKAQYDIWMLPVTAKIDKALDELLLHKLAILSKGR